MIGTEVALYRLFLALIAGSIIGIEREWRHKNAGLKTNALVAMGSAAFAMVSNTFGPSNHNPAQIAAAVVTGIGFIGAGVIIHRGATVQGVTTAATLWSNAGIGVAVGLGQTRVGIVLFAGVVLVQLVMRRVEVMIARKRRESVDSQIQLLIECDEAALPVVNAAWREFESSPSVTTVRQGVTRGGELLIWRTTFILRQSADLTRLQERMVGTTGVKKFDTRLIGYGD